MRGAFDQILFVTYIDSYENSNNLRHDLLCNLFLSKELFTKKYTLSCHGPSGNWGESMCKKQHNTVTYVCTLIRPCSEAENTSSGANQCAMRKLLHFFLFAH